MKLLNWEKVIITKKIYKKKWSEVQLHLSCSPLQPLIAHYTIDCVENALSWEEREAKLLKVVFEWNDGNCFLRCQLPWSFHYLGTWKNESPNSLNSA